MARKAPHAISYRLTKFETIAGWLYLPFYLIILNVLLQDRDLFPAGKGGTS